jgi:hypothetical protein
MNSGRRRPQPAALDWETQGWLTWRYARLYDQDPEFCEALGELYETHCTNQEQFLAGTPDLWDVERATWGEGWPSLPSAEWAHRYIAAIANTAERFGLHRLGKPRPTSGGNFQPNRGERLLHAWCSRRARARKAGRDWPAARFSGGVVPGGVRPQLGEVVSSEELPISTLGLAIIDAERRSLVRVGIEDEWDPRSETKANAKKRLLAEAAGQIDVALERIAVDAERSGYRFPDQDNAERDLTWLFWKVRLGLSYGRIVQRSRREHPTWLRKGRKAIKDGGAAADQDTDLVKRAVIRMADAVGIDRTRWETKSTGDS